MLRQGDYHWIMEEQKRSEVRDTSGIWWLCDDAQALCSLLALDLRRLRIVL